MQSLKKEYNVVENVAGSLDCIRLADYVLAFCGTEMYVIKSRGPGFEQRNPPRRPNLVMGYYQFPTPHIAEITLRSDCPTCSRILCRCQEEIEEIRYMNDPAIEYAKDE